MKLLQQSELKLGWKSAGVAFLMTVISVSPGIYRLLNSQKFVKSQSWDVAKILAQKVEEARFKGQTAIDRHLLNLTDMAAIDHDDDDINRKKQSG